jgi:amino acid adenylation domain-containing protein
VKKEQFIEFYSALSADKRQKALTLLREQGIDIRTFPIVCRPQDLPHPESSFSQRSLWFLEQIQPGNASYNMPGAVRLRGRLDVPALHATLNEIVRRHETLRTSFASTDGVPLQRIAAPLPLALPLTDLRGLAPAERDASAAALARAEAGAPFDLGVAPLLRVHLLQLADDEHVILFTLHHIIADGWSIGVLVREVAALYRAYTQGLPSPLPPLPIQYADFAHWQRSWLTGAVLERQLAYWKTQLADAPTLLALPTDRPRPAVQSHRGAAWHLTIPAATTGALRTLAQSSGATLFMVLAAAFNVLLARHAGQDDICIGTAIANRNRSETEDLIGFFVNSLVLRTRVDDDASFAALLAQVRSTTLDAYTHQDLPFEQLVEVLQPARHTSHAPLFQVMLILQNTRSETFELPGLVIAPGPGSRSTARFDLTLEAIETAHELECVFEYNTDLFDKATIERMADHFLCLLDAVAAAPATRVADLPLLAEAERAQLLADWNDTSLDWNGPASVHALFEAQVRANPHACAAVFINERLSYAELNERANRLAHYLRGRGVGPDVAVAVHLERSLALPVALLGVLKAGGAYLPIDPGHPQERVAFMLADVRPVLVLTEQHLLATLPADAPPALCLDSQWSLVAHESATDPAALAGPDHLAYIIYTSGSTGRPKGVAIAHGGIVNRMLWMQQAYQLTPADRVLQKTPFGFDVSVWEFFWTFATGAALILAIPGGHQDARYLADLIESEAVTTMHFVPPMLDAFLDQGDLLKCRSLRTVICSGQELPYELQLRFLRQLSGVALHNLYGPTEATVDVTSWDCAAPCSRDIVPIGKPIANTRIYLLDRHQRPVPVGVAGELHIAGEALARGYLNRPGLTADKFIPDPFGAVPGGRMYKTGDLARYLPDGNIEYLGRIDRQIKLRGFRIEPGEIEAALARLAGVREAVVLLREDTPGERRLVAYLTPQPDQSVPEPPQLRGALAEHLPDYMVPAHFVALQAFPLTPNGKVDKKALPALDQAMFAARVWESPLGAVETSIALSWQALLAVESIGRHDHFFELGGHSLLGTRVVSTIRSEFGVEFPLRALFEAPTVALLARRVEEMLLQGGSRATPAITRTGRNGPPPLSYSQQRLWFLNQLEPASTLYNMPAAIKLKGRLDLPALARTFNEVVRRHEVLRTRFADVDGAPVQIIAPTLDVPLPLADLSGLDDTERQVQVQAALAYQSHTPFDLAAGPLVRTGVIRLAADEHLLLFNMHHIVSDGWSIGVLISEVTAIYGAYVEGRTSPLAELPIQYSDFAEWQRSYLSGDVLARQLSYWHEQLDGAPALLTLPTDRPRPAVQSPRGGSATFAMPQHLAKGLHTLSKQHNATLFMTLTAAFGLLLSRYAGQSDVCIGTPIANRNRTELESMIGLFINTLVLRVRLAAASSFAELLEQARDTALGAYAHQDVPFEYLLDELQVTRNTSHSPLFQAMIVLQNAPDGELTLPGLSLQPLARDTGGAKSEIGMYVTAAEERIQFAISYRTDLFEAATIKEMGERFLHIVAQICAAPSIPLNRITLVNRSHTPEAGHPALIRRSEQFTVRAPFADSEIEQSIYARFHKQVERYPDRTAIVGSDGTFTYAELDSKVSSLAAYIAHAVGTGNEQIAILFDHNASVVIAILAALKAGKAYVPLDPTYPRARLEFILRDSQSTLLLTDRNNLAFANELAGASVMVVVADDAVSASLPSFPAACGPDSLAYILYTSGSTGQPKGVVQNHRNTLYFCKSYANNLQICPDDRIVLFASYSFDASVMDIFGALLNGATLVVISPKYKTSEELADALITHRISILHATPTLYRYILDSGAAMHTSPVELVVLGGEPVSAGDVELYKKRFKPDCMLINGYGPTESTLAAQYVFHKDTAIHAGRIPAGFSIDGTTILLNDPHSPAGTFLNGEIVIKSPHVALAYWNNPELTARAFGTDQAGNRYYRTGDLGRYVSGQSLMVSGRIDHQVKIRGFRIELAEIEAVLASLPCIRHVVVVTQERMEGDKVLVAFIVVHDGADIPGQDQLRRFALQSLPEYMVPSCFVVVDDFPLTASGKIDRGVLLHRDVGSQHALAQRESTDTDKKLMEIWRDVLQIQEIGTGDNFLSLGGNSLKIMKLKSQIEHTFGVHVELADLFNATALSMLSDHIDALQTLVQTEAAEVQVDEEAIDF